MSAGARETNSSGIPLPRYTDVPTSGEPKPAESTIKTRHVVGAIIAILGVVTLGLSLGTDYFKGYKVGAIIGGPVAFALGGALVIWPKAKPQTTEELPPL